MTHNFVQECIEAGEDALVLQAIRSAAVALEGRDCADRTPLMVALECARPVLVRELLALGADPNARSNDGDTCLSRAVDIGDLGSVDLLLRHGADLEQESANFRTPLALAVVRGQALMVGHLIERGANIEARGEMDETPLIEACRCADVDVVRVLLRHGADQSATDAFGRSARDLAMEMGNPEVLRTLSAEAGRA